MDLQTVRDWVVIVYGIFGIITFLIVSSVTALIGFGVVRVLGAVRNTLETRVDPTLSSLRGTSQSVRGGATFIMDAAAAPIIRTYGIVSGIRRGLQVLTGLRRGRRDR